ncbi:MAG: polysaccharide deacetylase family protein [Candidatus Firestonebacteria bacterium]
MRRKPLNRFQLFIWRACVLLVILTIVFAFYKVTEAVLKFSLEGDPEAVVSVQKQTALEQQTPEQKPPGPAFPELKKPVKCIALTFDDGPHPEFTLKLLNVLEQHDVKATFFVVGKMAVKYQGLLRAIHEYGHEIGNHTFNHPLLTKVSKAIVADELEKGRSAINSLTGSDVLFFRPPSGRYDSETVRIAAAHGLYTILWSVNSLDYGCNSSRDIEARVLANPSDGDIVLLHSGVKATLEALPAIIEGLKGKGFELKTLSEMMHEKCGNPKPGLFKSFRGPQDSLAVKSEK